jgi:prepilin-type processing-associated H-X9-DG protein
MRSIVFSLLFLFAPVAVVAGEPAYDVLATGSQRVVLFAPDFSVKWEHSAKHIHEAHRLPNGNILFADGRVIEVTPDKKVVFRYEPSEGKEGSYTCQRLPNGNTLIGENGSGLVKEIAPDGSTALELKIQLKTNDLHHQMRYVRKLESGNYLVCQSGDHLVREYTSKGEIVWEHAVPNIAFCAERLKNGNTIISSISQITEVAADGKTVWEFKNSELPDLGIRAMTGFQILSNGNLVIGCYDAYDNAGKGVGMFEITREKKLVWAYQKRPDRNMMGVEMQEPDANRKHNATE